ncbi:hypothetical protein [Thiothrix subterranea]|uniref:EF-hand domain-containing protein n=1 Tax=Thiothrix subterranea TaxID=2735563 RepID=A0ABU0Y728_9GAMM|nr:hypothetical protein [Thiothrix subterranea]MDQ5768570.1 hypothetical protein [Thiothrix subterranea]
MMKTNTSLKLALGATFAVVTLGAGAVSAENPFAANTLTNGYMQLAENKADGEMKCGAGMCGANMKAGEGKCGGDMDCPADADKDGKVTKEEFMTHHEKMFTEADADKDGSLSADERKALHSKMGEGKCGGKEGTCGGNKEEKKDDKTSQNETFRLNTPFAAISIQG